MLLEWTGGVRSSVEQWIYINEWLVNGTVEFSEKNCCFDVDPKN